MARLTNSPQGRKASEWTRARLAEWGLQNARLEPWGPFGRGWSLESFSMQIVEPQTIPLIAVPKAWTPGFDKPIVLFSAYVGPELESAARELDLNTVAKVDTQAVIRIVESLGGALT